MFWCEKENRWCSVWSCDRKECEFLVRASDKERFYQCLTCRYIADCNLDEDAGAEVRNSVPMPEKYKKEFGIE